MSNRLGEFFRDIKASAENIVASVEEVGRMVQGLDSNKSSYHDGYTLKVGQKFQMWRVIRETGQTYLSPGEIVGFKENGTYVVTERCSRTRGKKIPEEYTIEEFVRKINRGEVTGISKDSDLAELINEERAARKKELKRIDEIRRSIRDSIGAEAGVETPREETAKIYDNTRGIETYATPDGEVIACYTSQYKGETQEDRAVVGAREIGGRVVKLMCAIDGIGGSAHGEFAAQAFAESIQEIFNELKELPAPSGSVREWQIIEDKLIIPAMNKAREKIREQAQKDRSYIESSCVFAAVVIVGNEAYFYTAGDGIGAHFSLKDKTVRPHTTRVNVRIEDGQEYVSGYVGLGLEGIKPLADVRTLKSGDVVVVATDGITDNFTQGGGRGVISENMCALLSGEESGKEPNEKQGEVTSSEEIAGHILDYVQSLGDNAKKDNQTFMVYYHSGQPQTN